MQVEQRKALRAFVLMVSASLFLRFNGKGGTLIDFETVPGTVPTNGLIISNQYTAAYGVTFRPLGSAIVGLTQTGSDAVAFGFCLGPANASVCTKANHLYPSDPLADAIGNYFLSLGGILGTPYGLVVDLNVPVSQTGGFIMDVDGTDQWTVKTYSDTNGVNLTDEMVITAGDPGTGDGVATLFTFRHPTADIQEIQFVFTGNPQNGLGEGFDLLSFGQLPLDVPTLSIDQHRLLSLTGRAGRNYQVDYTPSPTATNWSSVTNLTLPVSPFVFTDPAATNASRFYRALLRP